MLCYFATDYFILYKKLETITIVCIDILELRIRRYAYFYDLLSFTQHESLQEAAGP